MKDVDAIKARIVAAASCPRNRVGMRPNRTSSSWRFEPSCDSISVIRGKGPLHADPAVALERFAARRASNSALRIETIDDYLLVEYDHGLGDMHFIAEIIALASSSAPDFAPPQPTVNCDTPARTATMHALRTAPLSFVKSAMFRPKLQVPAVSLGEATGAASTLYTRTPLGFIDRIREARDARLPGVSLVPIIVVALIRSMWSHGVDTDASVDMLVDLRRFLPPGANTLANFGTVTSVPMKPPADVVEFAAAVADGTAGYRPLARQMLANLVWTLRPVPPVMPTWQTPVGPARLVVTDITARQEMSKVSWLPDRPPTMILSMHGRQTHQLTFGLGRIGSEAHLSLNYYRSNFDGELLRKALDDVPHHMMDVLGMNNCPSGSRPA
jgi:hypothetical protein